MHAMHKMGKWPPSSPQSSFLMVLELETGAAPALALRANAILFSKHEVDVCWAHIVALDGF